MIACMRFKQLAQAESFLTPFRFAFIGEAMPGRIPVLKDETMLLGMIKEHLEYDPSKTRSLWMHKTSDEVIDQYDGLLVAIAHTKKRISVGILTEGLKKHFEGSPAVLKDFSKVMANALSYARSKMKNTITGEKTAEKVLSIMRAYGWKPGENATDDVNEDAEEIEDDEESDVNEISDVEMTITPPRSDIHSAIMKAFSKDMGAPSGSKRQLAVQISSDVEACPVPPKVAKPAPTKASSISHVT